MNKLVIVGNGKLAEAIEKDFCRYSDLQSIKYTPDMETDTETVFVHVGSGRQYKESLELALKNNSSYIQAATEKKVKMNKPENNKIKYINAPNLDLNIIKLFYLLNAGKNLFNKEKICILESHQKEKESEAGTAVKFSDILNIPKEEIISLRDTEKQKALGIKNTKHHAYHQINIGDENSEIVIKTKIEGALSYVKGLARIIECIPKLENRNHEIDELVKLKLL